MNPESLRQLDVPQSFATRPAAAHFAELRQSQDVLLDGLEREKLIKIAEILGHPELGALIDEGKVTLGIIKPQVNQGIDLPQSDEEASDRILEEIGEKAIFNISLHLTLDESKRFYAPLEPKYKDKIDVNSGKSVWEAITDFTSSGPLTIVLIYDEGGNAVEWWREKMGDTYPDKASRDSIRGRHATNSMLPNNLVHGSDAPEEVKREVVVLHDILLSISGNDNGSSASRATS